MEMEATLIKSRLAGRMTRPVEIEYSILEDVCPSLLADLISCPAVHYLRFNDGLSDGQLYPGQGQKMPIRLVSCQEFNEILVII